MKRILWLPVILGMLFLAGCVEDTPGVESIQVIRYAYESDGDSLVPEVLKTWTFTDEEETSHFLNQLRRKTKTDAKIDIRPRDYLVKVFYTDGSHQQYDLWLDEDIYARGILMQGDNTWMIHEASNETLYRILQ